MRRRLLAAFAVIGAVTLGACSGPTECGPDASSSTITVRAAKPGVSAVQCWSGCAPEARELEPTGSDEWTATLAEDRPERLTLAAHGAGGGLLFAERFNVEWSGCPAAPVERELVLLRPEGGTGARE
jgi:hypothetical protein